MSVNQTQAYQIQEKLAALEEALQEQAPGIENLLKDIHIQLKKDPDIVTILTNEESAVIVSGLKKQTATIIATAALKAKPKKSLKSTTVDDL